MTQVQDRPATRKSTSEYASEDIGNIVSLEHVNTCTPDLSLSTAFYLMGMGFTRDPYVMIGVENETVRPFGTLYRPKVTIP